MRVYLAGTFTDQAALRAQAAALWALGHEITGTWLQEVKKPADMSEDTFKRKLAIKDLCEVARADLVILDNRRSSGGKNAEWGFALGEFQTKQLWLVGEPTNVFQYLADEKFRDWDELLSYMKGVDENDVERSASGVGSDKVGDTTASQGPESAGGPGESATLIYTGVGNPYVRDTCNNCAHPLGALSGECINICCSACPVWR